MLMVVALTPRSRAMPGRAVASTVPSSCSMNMAAPTIRPMVRKCGVARAGALCKVFPDEIRSLCLRQFLQDAQQRWRVVMIIPPGLAFGDQAGGRAHGEPPGVQALLHRAPLQ